MSATDQAELDAILAAVRDEPDEDVHRLAAADWWDDHGDADRAEFVRVQLALARLDAELIRCGNASCPGCRERAGLEARQRNLLQWPRFWDWFGPVIGDAWPGSPAVSIRPDLTCEVGYFVGRAGEVRWRLRPRRGFVDVVRAPLVDWLRWSARWFERTPLLAYQPSSVAPSPRDEIRAHGVTFWQDESVGRLRVLDLSAVLRDRPRPGGHGLNDRWYAEFMAGSRYAFRPWRGLRRVVLPGGYADLEQSRRLQWRALIPGVEVTFRQPAEENP